MLQEYYQRLRDKLEEKINTELEADSPSFNPVATKKDLELLQECIGKIEELDESPTADWDRLNPITKKKILNLIEADLKGEIGEEKTKTGV